MAGVCKCGRRIWGVGARCPRCQTTYRAARAQFRKTDKPREKFRKGRCPAHLAWIRSLPCAIAGCPGRSQAAHVRISTDGGMGLKPSDRWAVPLCGPTLTWIGHHREQHQLGHAEFGKRYRADLRALAESYAARSPYLHSRGEI